MDFIKIWSELRLERGVQSGRLDSVFHVKTHQLTRWIWVLKMKIHHQLSSAVVWVGFGLGWMVWAGGLGLGLRWTALAKGIWMKCNYSLFTHKIFLLFLFFYFNLFIFSHFFIQ